MEQSQVNVRGCTQSRKLATILSREETTTAKNSPRNPDMKHVQSAAYDVIQEIYAQDSKQIEEEVQDLNDIIKEKIRRRGEKTFRHNPKSIDMGDIRPQLLQKIQKRVDTQHIHNSASFWTEDSGSSSITKDNNNASFDSGGDYSAKLPRLRASKRRYCPQTDPKREAKDSPENAMSYLSIRTRGAPKTNISLVNSSMTLQKNPRLATEPSNTHHSPSPPRNTILRMRRMTVLETNHMSQPRKQALNCCSLDLGRHKRKSLDLRRKLIRLNKLFAEKGKVEISESKETKIGMMVEEYKKERKQRTHDLLTGIEVTDARILPAIYDYRLQSTLNHEAETYKILKDFRNKLEDPRREVAKIERNKLQQKRLKRIMLQHRRILKV